MTTTRAGLAACATLAALGLAARPAAAQDAYYPNDTTVKSAVGGNVYVGYAGQSDLSAHTNGTSPTVTFSTGSSVGNNLQVYNASTVNIGAGSTINGNTQTTGLPDVTANDSSTVNISNGSTINGTVLAQGNSTVNVTGGTITGLQGNGNRLNVSGGTITKGLSLNSGTANISGGLFSAPYINAVYGGTVNISGGSFGIGLDVYGGTLTISGGTFGASPVGGTSVNFFDDSLGGFTFVGTGLSDVFVGNNSLSGKNYLLTGVLQNGQSITGDIIDVVNGATMFTLAAAPEPSQSAALTLGTLGLSALALRARRRRACA